MSETAKWTHTNRTNMTTSNLICVEIILEGGVTVFGSCFSGDFDVWERVTKTPKSSGDKVLETTEMFDCRTVFETVDVFVGMENRLY